MLYLGLIPIHYLRSDQGDLGQRETGIILDMDSANERRRYIATISIVNWAYTQKTLYKFYMYEGCIFAAPCE